MYNEWQRLPLEPVTDQKKDKRRACVMKKNACFVVCGVILAGMTWSLDVVHAGMGEPAKAREAIAVLEESSRMPEKTIPPTLMKNAAGIAVIPSLVKAGFVVGGRHGKGLMSIRGQDGRWTYPFFVTLTGGSVGWQIGVQTSDIVLVFTTKKSIDSIRRGKFTLGADASVAAGPVGRHAEAGTDLNLKAEIFSYSRSRGLFAGVALEGSSLAIDHVANAAFYNTPGIDLAALMAGQVKKLPPEADGFLDALEKTGTMRQQEAYPVQVEITRNGDKKTRRNR